jgi:hypothetical protein
MYTGSGSDLPRQTGSSKAGMHALTKEKLPVLICKTVQDSRIFNTFSHRARLARSDPGPEAKKNPELTNNSGSAKRSRYATLPSDEDAYLAKKFFINSLVINTLKASTVFSSLEQGRRHLSLQTSTVIDTRSTLRCILN